MSHTHHKLFIFFILLIFVALVVVFNVLPRSTYSELERRELAQFPEFSLDSLFKGAWARDVSVWFSDTEPYREEFMTLNMAITKNLALPMPYSDDADVISFHATSGSGDPGAQAQPQDNPLEGAIEMPNIEGAAVSDSISNADAHVASSGILVVGAAPKARALMIYGAGPAAGKSYASAINEYHTTLGSGVRIYCMPIPTSVEFYCPEKAKKMIKSQSATINGIFSSLSGVKGVDCYTPISQHANEDVYLRTDHHWAPLGAYYAAQAFAKAAGVPFGDLSKYERHVVRNFVGTMYGYSKDISVKQSPEDFVYYTPTGVDYSTTYINYNTNKDHQVTGMGKPYSGKFFMHYSDGSGAAYSTFMGGDVKITQVKTSTRNGRRLLILKDSFGNAVPGYLFYSFEEIHVVDFRYFTYNIVDYIKTHGVTDVLFANGIFNSCGSTMASKYRKFLTQKGGVIVAEPSSDAKKENSDSVDPAPDSSKAEKPSEKSSEKPSENTSDKETHKPEPSAPAPSAPASVPDNAPVQPSAPADPQPEPSGE